MIQNVTPTYWSMSTLYFISFATDFLDVQLQTISILAPPKKTFTAFIVGLVRGKELRLEGTYNLQHKRLGDCVPSNLWIDDTILSCQANPQACCFACKVLYFF